MKMPAKQKQETKETAEKIGEMLKHLAPRSAKYWKHLRSN